MKKSKKSYDPVSEKENQKIKSDVSGSYTGIPLDEKYPVQDADDL